MAEDQTFELSNFRKEDQIENWPLGRGERGTAVFTHEHNSRGQRIGRQTPYKGRLSKPKYSVYYRLVCLADGSDGKTHMIGLSPHNEQIAVMSCDMKFSDFALFEGDENFAEYRQQLLDVAG